MLRVDLDLPQGALLGTATGGGNWPKTAILYRAPQGPDSALALRAEGDVGPVLHPVEGNDEGCPVEQIGGTPYLAYEKGAARGFASVEPVDMSSAGIAVLFRAGADDPLTLASLCPPETRRYLHLSVRDGVAEFGYRDTDGARMACPPMAGPMLIMAEVSGDRLAIAVNAQAPVTKQSERFEAGPQNIFLGCRRHRAGLRNSLGGARIAELAVFPDLDLFGDAGRAVRASRLQRQRALSHGL